MRTETRINSGHSRKSDHILMWLLCWSYSSLSWVRLDRSSQLLFKRQGKWGKEGVKECKEAPSFTEEKQQSNGAGKKRTNRNVTNKIPNSPMKSPDSPKHHDNQLEMSFIIYARRREVRRWGSTNGEDEEDTYDYRFWPTVREGLPVGENMRSTTSVSQRMARSPAFLTIPCFRWEYLACLSLALCNLRIGSFLLPISALIFPLCAD